MEFAQALLSRYLQASKEEKGKIFDEFTQVTGLHRKAAIRLLHRTSQQGPGKRQGRPRKYGVVTVEELKALWEASDRLYSSVASLKLH